MRLSYNWTGHIGQSRQTFATNGGVFVKVVVDKLNGQYEIVNQRNEVIVSGGDGTKNYIVLLRKIKRALDDLGVELVKEERNRDYGLVRKKIRNFKGVGRLDEGLLVYLMYLDFLKLYKIDLQNDMAQFEKLLKPKNIFSFKNIMKFLRIK